jgi:hypothetical protein
VSTLNAINTLLLGLLTGTGMGAGLSWLALRRHHRGLAAETEMAHLHAQAATRAALASLRLRHEIDHVYCPALPECVNQLSLAPHPTTHPDPADLIHDDNPTARHTGRALAAATSSAQPNQAPPG